MKELLQKIEEYKEGKISTPELQDALILHISRLNVEFLEERFGKVENIGCMLGFYEVADAIYDTVKQDFQLTEDDLDKDIHLKAPIGLLDFFTQNPKKVSIHSTIERVIGKIKDLHDRKKLNTIRYKVTFNNRTELFKVNNDLKLLSDRIACVEKHEKSLIIYTYTNIEKELTEILRDRYNCDLTEI